MREAEETRAEVKAVLKRMVAAARSSSGTVGADERQTNDQAEQVDIEIQLSVSLSVIWRSL